MHLKMVTLLKIMTKRELFFGAIFWGILTDVWQFCNEFYLALCFKGYSNIQGVPKKAGPCLNGHNSHKNDTRNKSKVSFVICM